MQQTPQQKGKQGNASEKMCVIKADSENTNLLSIICKMGCRSKHTTQRSETYKDG
jgi:hypothetical protein